MGAMEVDENTSFQWDSVWLDFDVAVEIWETDVMYLLVRSGRLAKQPS